MKELRTYQEAATKSLWLFLHNTTGLHPLVVAPVGAGKSLLIGEFVKRIHAEYPRTRIVMLTHVKELLEQNMLELKEQYPSADAGFYSASLKQKRMNNDVTFASIQSIYSKANEFNRAPELILVDECHLIPHKIQTRYRKFIDDCLKLNPNLRCIGFTGTPFRADSGRLDEGDNRLFDSVAYEIPMKYMFDEGFLCRPILPEGGVKTLIDVEGVKTRGGDYIQSELEKAVDKAEITDPCVEEIIELGKDRKRWLVFTAGIDHCMHVYQAFIDRGIACDMITGKTPQKERKAIIERYNKGELTCLVNVAVLTTGFNSPPIDLLAFMRPTRSPVLYVQIIGRGLRPVYAAGYDLSTKQGRLDAIANSGKPNCLVLDFGQVVQALGAIDEVEIRKQYTEEEKKQSKPQDKKICPSCGELCYIQQRTCHKCGYVFSELKLDNKADKQSKIVSDEDKPLIYKVIGMKQFLNPSRDEAKPPTMRVEYATMFKTVKEWVSFEGAARWRGEAWHKARFPKQPCPQTVADALNIKYPMPDTVEVVKEKTENGTEWDVVKKCNFKGAVYDDIPFIL
jgi:DNA repair protein RadD